MHIAFYVSGHGFGHASRAGELMKALAERRSSARFTIRTMIPAWMFERVPHARVEALETDTGLVQIDSLHFDEQATAERTAAFYRDFDRRVDDEASWLREHRVELVVGDIPPLAFAAADRAEIPSVAFGNFTWDWIYSAYAPFETDVPEVIPIIRRAYAKATRALRLPFHGGFEPMRQVVQDVPLVARKSRRDARETRHTLGVREDLPLVLASFGAYGAALPHAAGTDRESFTLLNIAQHPPHGLAYEDVVAAADVVVSKPGYGIVSECIANQTALLYTSRGQFVEYDCFVDQMPRVLRCRYISQGELLRGEWSDAIRALLDQPAPPDTPRVDGAEISADIILGLRPD